MLKLKNLTALVFLSSGLAGAHLKAGSLSPKGGENLKVGETVSITWTVETPHSEGIDIAFSKDGGMTWTTFKTGFVDETDTLRTFRWTIPSEAVTTKGKFRICQSGPCTDAQNVSKPSGNGSPWVLVSNTFTVQATTGIATSSNAVNPLSLDFHPDTRSLEVSFGLSESGPVLLQAFDIQGRMMATLLQGNYAAGTHTLSVFSNQLGSASGSLVFKLKAGDQVRTHTWMPLR